jgi:hypothetical protein
MLPVPDTTNIQRGTADIFIEDRIFCIQHHICTACNAKIKGLKNSLSQKEYLISGLCQACQDLVFDEQKTPPAWEKAGMTRNEYVRRALAKAD